MKEIDYAAPATLTEATALLARKGARALAGGTDLIVQVRENRRDAELLVDLKNIAELNTLRFDAKEGLVLGAAVPCYRIAEHPDVRKRYPGLGDGVALIGGVQIQSRASVGGNLCNASPAADSIPALIALGASAVIATPSGTRDLIPVEKFCTGPGRTILGPGELLVHLHLPPPAPNSSSAYLRFIPRKEMDIAVVGVGVALALNDNRTACVFARIALGAVGPTPLLVPEAGAALAGRPLAEADLERAAELAQAQALPISDMRGSADYRRHLVGVLVKRALRIALQRVKGG
ncbi:MAG: xanthine dehydrogenase family protein subunit M [Planctomycetes bacterium]|nr:xanthine dehydrogenase family protein subunit M [Planctomycetota bacterium]